MGLLIVAAMLGAVLATAAAIAIWLALGNSTLMRRTIWGLLGSAIISLMFCITSGELEAEWLGLVLVVVITIAFMFGVARCFGFRLVGTMSRGQTSPDESNFSIGQLMALTAVIASMIAAARTLAPLLVTIDALIFGTSIALCLGTLALVTGWAMLQSQVTGQRLATLVAVMMAAAGLVYYVMEVTDADPGIVWGATIVFYTTALAGLLLLARSYGICLQRRRDRGDLRAEAGTEARRATKDGLRGA